MAATAGAQQMANGQEGEGMLGLAAQNDATLFQTVKLSPVGLHFGLIVQPAFGRRRMAIVEQVSLFPVISYDRRRSPFRPPIRR